MGLITTNVGWKIAPRRPVLDPPEQRCLAHCHRFHPSRETHRPSTTFQTRSLEQLRPGAWSAECCPRLGPSGHIGGPRMLARRSPGRLAPRRHLERGQRLGDSAPVPLQEPASPGPPKGMLAAPTNPEQGSELSVWLMAELSGWVRVSATSCREGTGAQPRNGAGNSG